MNKETKEQLRGKIVICDLAGSERLKRSQVTEDMQKVTPYRNHKLTQLMQDSLGGTAKTLMFVNCSPASSEALQQRHEIAQTELTDLGNCQTLKRSLVHEMEGTNKREEYMEPDAKHTELEEQAGVQSTPDQNTESSVVKLVKSMRVDHFSATRFISSVLLAGIQVQLTFEEEPFRSLLHAIYSTLKALAQLTDLFLNVLLLASIPFVPLGFLLVTFTAFFFSHVYIHYHDNCLMLGCISSSHYANTSVGWLAEFIAVIQCGVMPSAFAFKAICNVFSNANVKAFRVLLYGNVSRLIAHHSRVEFLMLVSHCEAKAGTEASLVQPGPETRAKGDTAHPGHGFKHLVFLDTEELRNPTRVRECVQNTRNHVILITSTASTTQRHHNEQDCSARGEHGAWHPCIRVAESNRGKRRYRADVRTKTWLHAQSDVGLQLDIWPHAGKMKRPSDLAYQNDLVAGTKCCRHKFERRPAQKGKTLHLPCMGHANLVVCTR